MRKVKIAFIGLGTIGQYHLSNLSKIDNTELAAVCDIKSDVAEKTASQYGCKWFTNHNELLDSKICEAVLIATPHYMHTRIGIDALDAGYHVMVEKPISVHKTDCEKLISAHKNKKQVFAAMFNQRTDPKYIKLKQLIDSGELGKLFRVTWVITDWFRTNAYYATGSWRATWAGEGGGVLLNQCPHQLDLFQWICGMPTKVHGFCGLGKRHNIEVEDEVTAYFEFANGATGVFIASTGEAPGTNRLEICGDKGKVIVEEGIKFMRNEAGAIEYIQNSPGIDTKPDVWNIDIPITGAGDQHIGVIKNFSDAILNGAELIAPAQEGILSIELANSILYSSLTNQTVELPLNGTMYEKKLQELISNSKNES